MKPFRKAILAFVASVALVVGGSAFANGFANFTVSNQRTSLSINQELFSVLNVSLNVGGSLQYRYALPEPTRAFGFVTLSYTGSTWVISLEATTEREYSISYGFFW